MALSREEAKARRKSHGSFPSRDVDLKTALEIFSWNAYRFARSTEALGEEAITELLAALAEAHPHEPRALFLQTAVDRTQLKATWRAAVNALKRFEAQYGWGSKEKRAQLAAIAKEPRLVAGAQAAAVGAAHLRNEFLAVLALDGSDESMDALLPHFARAAKDPAQLDVLSRLVTYAKKTEALTALLDDVAKRRSERIVGSPVLALGKRLGLVKSDTFRASLRAESVEKDAAAFAITFDNTKVEAFRVGVFNRRKNTEFDSLGLQRDDFKLGACGLDELPAWLASAEQKLSVKWDRASVSVKYLRGDAVKVFTDWLLGHS
jgi:hypothetical protein